MHLVGVNTVSTRLLFDTAYTKGVSSIILLPQNLKHFSYLQVFLKYNFWVSTPS